MGRMDDARQAYLKKVFLFNPEIGIVCADKVSWYLWISKNVDSCQTDHQCVTNGSLFMSEN